MFKKYKLGSNISNTMIKTIEKCSSVKDESDPDNEFEQIVHYYQTGEFIFDNYMQDAHNIKKDISIKNLFREDEWQNLP